MSQPSSLTAKELQSYQEDGFLIRPAVFTDQETDALRAAAENACQVAIKQASEGQTYHLDGKRFVDINYWTVQFEYETERQSVRVIEPVNELDARFDDLIDAPQLVQPMQDILGSTKLALWTAKLNLKPANVGSGFGWHQDSPYWIHDSDHVDLLPNVMVTIDEASVENGCLQVIRGSHKKGCLPGTDDGSQLGGFFTSPECFSESNAVPMEAPAGSAIFFSPHSIHGSGPNRSTEDRKAVILTYQPANYPALKSGQVRSVG